MKQNKIYKIFRRVTCLTALLLTFGIVVLPAGYAGAAEEILCQKIVTVTDGGDSGNTTTTGQLPNIPQSSASTTTAVPVLAGVPVV